MYTLNVERVVDAPANIVWDVISDVEAYASYAPNLGRAVKTSDGDTPSRRCWDTQGRGWDEACVLWEEGKQYSYVIDTSDYPYPFTQMKGTWSMEEVESGIRITMKFEYTPNQPSVFGWMIHQSVKQQFTHIVDELMDNWEAEILTRKNATIVAAH